MGRETICIAPEAVGHLKWKTWPDDPEPHLAFAFMDEDRPIAALRVWKREFKSPCLTGGAWAIGQVWVDEGFRHKGCATRMIIDTLDRLRKEDDRVFVFLIGRYEAGYELYRRIGFLPLYPIPEKPGQCLYGHPLIKKMYLRVTTDESSIREWSRWKFMPEDLW
jgi:GNAT superfamily N-acetyltransferase